MILQKIFHKHVVFAGISTTFLHFLAIFVWEIIYFAITMLACNLIKAGELVWFLSDKADAHPIYTVLLERSLQYIEGQMLPHGLIINYPFLTSSL